MATGGTNQAFTYQPLYVNEASGQPLSMGCTIDTNGQNFLAVYLDGTQVYSNSELSLGYQEPFYFFLETQTSYTGGMFYGSFQNFYLTSSDSVTVTNMPSDSTAELVSSSGQVLASAAASSGTATLAIPQYDMPLVANIQVTSVLGVQIASTSSPVSIWGGNSYSLSLLGLGNALASSSPAPSASSVTSSVAATPAAVSQAGQTASTIASPVASSTSGPLVALSLVVGLGAGASRAEEPAPSSSSESTSKSSHGQEGAQ
jgi:hypothetical protein